MACFFRFPALKTLYALAALLISTGWAGSAAAEVLLNPSHLCHAVSAKVAPRGTLPPHFSCRGEPEGYQHGSLWLRADLARVAVDPGNLALLVHYSRFDRLEVTFTYLDGREVRQSVRSGDFGTHWRSGGQLHFSAPDRDSPLRYVTMRFDRLASAEMLRMRLLDRDEASLESMILSGWVGATLTLLLAGTVYNVSLAISLRRQFPVWQAGWSMCMFAWGALWSQLHLLIAPGLAGTISAQLCSALACLAITSAALSAITALETHELPRAARYTVLTLACSASLLGMPVAMIRSGPVDTLVAMVGILLILTMLGVAACLAWAWRQGSAEARAFASAWLLPIGILSTTDLLSSPTSLWGGGSQLLVLVAAAWQTLWLTAAASRTHAQLRIEHDRVLSAEAHAYELARRDPLTGLSNRRGFVEAVAPIFEKVRSGEDSAALLLIDVDLFKRINDTFGHDAGDMVLVTIAERIARWESASCKVARFGGEEFALMTSAMRGQALVRFADKVRQSIAACRHDEAIGDGKVTVSIGLAEAEPQTDFRSLYKLADEALYSAKHQGRNCVVVRTSEHAASPSTGQFEVAR